jgi:hypothetical protein
MSKHSKIARDSRANQLTPPIQPSTSREDFAQTRRSEWRN